MDHGYSFTPGNAQRSPGHVTMKSIGLPLNVGDYQTSALMDIIRLKKLVSLFYFTFPLTVLSIFEITYMQKEVQYIACRNTLTRASVGFNDPPRRTITAV